jgi:hypothetical protein
MNVKIFLRFDLDDKTIFFLSKSVNFFTLEISPSFLYLGWVIDGEKCVYLFVLKIDKETATS